MIKTIVVGPCRVCGSDILSRQIYMDDPANERGIILTVWGKTGYWTACSNKDCEQHEGEGTLSRRPHDLP